MPEFRSLPGKATMDPAVFLQLDFVRSRLPAGPDRDAAVLSLRQHLSRSGVIVGGQVDLDRAGAAVIAWAAQRTTTPATPQPRQQRPRIRRRLAGGYRSPDLPDPELD